MHRPPPIVSVAAAAAALMILAGNAGAQYAISQTPPLTTSPPTNIVMMMDDSGSMAWAYVPDAYGACTGWRRFNAGSFNALAYNPNLVYQSPTIITSTSNVPQPQTTSFNAAWIDGFNTTTSSAVAIDLSGGYQPTASYQPSQTGQQFSPHPVQDLVQIFAPNAPPANAGAGGQGSNCGASYSGSGGGGGNQFGPATSTNTAVGAPAYYYVYNAALTGCTASVNDDNCYQYVRVTAASAPAGAKDVNGNLINGFQNFANWYSFYRTRHLMIASAAASAMADPVFTQARVTWRALNSCTDMVSGPTGPNPCAGWDGYIVDNQIRIFNDVPVASGQPSQRAAFYKWLTRIPAASPTPTRSTWTYIGDYFSAPSPSNTAIGSTSLGANGPYGINPNPAGAVQAANSSAEVACVQNYSITLTDGQWNQDNNTYGAFFGNADATATTFPDGVAYSPTQTTPSPNFVYGNDPNHDTLSDIAFHYWSTNLRPDLSGSATAVAPYYQIVTGSTPTVADYWNPQNDPATWPHLVQMTIGVGMTSTMTVPGLNWWGNDPTTQYRLDSTTNPGFVLPGVTYPNAGWDNLWYGNAAWPAINNAAMQGDMGKAYDLWHAAVNSRGLAFSSESASDLVNAMKASVNRIKAPMSAQSAVATNSTAMTNGTLAFVASYTSSDWHGTVRAYGFTNGTLNTNWTWSTDSAGSFAPPTTRSIATSSTQAQAATPSVASGIEFSMASGAFSNIWNAAVTATYPASVATDSANILSWVRGDPAQELRNGGAYRNRYTSVLGDIVSSQPVFSWHENFGYAALAPEGMSVTPNYPAFLQTKGNTAGSIYSGQGMVYVGANDGMLHGIDAATGKEVCAYAPHNVVPNMPALANPSYSHQFYVNQTPYVGDACVGSGPTSCTWETVLVGTTGAGGQGVFALNVTNPAGLESASGAASSVLWDLDGKAAVGNNSTNTNGDPDLGYPIGRPTIARLNNGDWSAIFGNGYLSSNGCAVLFIVRLSDGQVTRIGTTGAAQSTVCTTTNVNASNGLGPVTLADVDGNQTTDFVYAGDLQGNMWKFDLTAASSGSWKVAFNGFPLFSASSGTCYPAVNSTAANTCQYITSAPVLGPALPGLTGTMVYFGTGRVFAIGDLTTTSMQSFYGILDDGTNAVTGGQSALTQETITDNGTTRTVSANVVAPPSKGYFMNLPDTGERVTFSPLLFKGYLLFATEVPSMNTCSAGGSGWFMAVSATSNTVGGGTPFVGTAKGVGGIVSTVGLPEGIVVLTATPGGGAPGSPPPDMGGLGSGGSGTLVGSGTSGTLSKTLNTAGVKGRVSWHELVR